MSYFYPCNANSGDDTGGRLTPISGEGKCNREGRSVVLLIDFTRNHTNYEPTEEVGLRLLPF